jgi:ABC-type transport system involved in multi-copper enzyme maturation permease subunit
MSARSFGPNDLLRLWRVELWKLWTRLPARIGIAVSVFIGVVMPFVALGSKWAFFQFAAKAAANIQREAPAWEPVARDTGLMLALGLRSFFVIATFIILLGAVAFAGEFRARTLREDLIRPVPRTALLLSKWLALCSWVWMSVAATWVPGLLVSILILRGEGDLASVTLGFVSTGIADCMLAGLVLAVSVLSRSVPGTIAGVLLFSFLETTLWAALWIARQLPLLPQEAREILTTLAPFLPASSFSIWRGYAEAFDWAGLGGLGLVSFGAMGLAWLVFRRMDVP